uniref:Uncharacterized protein n=1 Tax=Loa loa TaxID=7209 RepID=A0A1I7V9D7_LOALO
MNKQRESIRRIALSMSNTDESKRNHKQVIRESEVIPVCCNSVFNHSDIFLVRNMINGNTETRLSGLVV